MSNTDNNTVDPGPGYRLLKVGEIIKAGDEFRSISGGWHSTEEAGEKYDRSGVEYCMYYRRKIDTASFINPGPGYRLLKVGEIIQKGDEFWHSTELRWKISSFAGTIRREHHDEYRRKIEVEPAPIETSEPEHTKPPLGLCPEYVWASNRAADILAAMTRYVAAGQKLPYAWITELEDRLHEAKLVELTEDK
jgi:hypothetical protein